ncbi:hypothetical protein E2C01_006218 [Portunus trituberculatus]|uniref:Uncharacterized protein n=1 Tax=Portunus trituberculatus TaxID=210409 RepID=A0A5B7CXA3_PORTR|nr:hypothetical protein [Portunus trituberculatus]
MRWYIETVQDLQVVLAKEKFGNHYSNPYHLGLRDKSISKVINASNSCPYIAFRLTGIQAFGVAG